MIREAMIFTLLALTLWCLHGLDMQFYTIENAYLFDVNLFIAVMSTISIGVLTMLDLKRFKNGKMA